MGAIRSIDSLLYERDRVRGKRECAMAALAFHVVLFIAVLFAVLSGRA